MAEENGAAEAEENAPDLVQPDSGGGDEEGGGGAPEWMATFADLVTLLMCFFVLLFAMSSIQEETFKELVQSLRTALGVQELPEAGTREGLIMDNTRPEEREKQKEAVDELGGMVQKEVEEIVSDVKELIMYNKLGGMVNVQESDVGAVITISDVVLFPPGGAKMVPEGLEIMAQVAQVLAQFRYPIHVAGHTDTSPIHTATFPSNWELSTRRASEVVRYLVSRGIDPRMMAAHGYAQFRPVDTNDTAQGRAKNRRVEIVYERTSMAKVLER